MALGFWLQTDKLLQSVGHFHVLVYVLDLSNEVLKIDFGQETSKISEVKVGG